MNLMFPPPSTPTMQMVRVAVSLARFDAMLTIINLIMHFPPKMLSIIICFSHYPEDVE